MHKPVLACHVWSSTLPFYTPVIQELPPEMTQIIFSGPDFASLETMRAKGYAVRPVAESNLEAYSLILCDENEFFSNGTFDRLVGTSARFCCLRHSTDHKGCGVPGAQYSIRPHQMLAEAVDQVEWTVNRDNEELFRQALALPPHAKTEYAYTGPYHLGPWETKRAAPMRERRQELEEALGRSLPSDKPVVAFFLDEQGQYPMLVAGLRSLSEHATIIYKGLTKDDPCLAALGDAVIPWPSLAYAPNILRFGADFLLVGYNSGTFTSSIMLGLRPLPFFTTVIHPYGRRSSELASFNALLPGDVYQNINQCCMGGFGAIFDIEATDKLMAAMRDDSFWDAYNERLPDIQKLAFGAYQVEGASKKTAALVLRALLTGSFGAEAYKIVLHPHWKGLPG